MMLERTELAEQTKENSSTSQTLSGLDQVSPFR